MKIEIEELLEAIKGYGDDTQVLTIGILKAILLDLNNKKENDTSDKRN
jgi:hypothetical protein